MRRCLPCNQHRLQAQLDRAAVERRNRNLKIMRAIRNPK